VIMLLEALGSVLIGLAVAFAGMRRFPERLPARPLVLATGPVAVVRRGAAQGPGAAVRPEAGRRRGGPERGGKPMAGGRRADGAAAGRTRPGAAAPARPRKRGGETGPGRGAAYESGGPVASTTGPPLTAIGADAVLGRRAAHCYRAPKPTLRTDCSPIST
ncbi:hypothetical protein, partial [Streptomyces sp. Ru87]|uniref:hypothetical protein n=1 Tax=Streptomyces sp. Ru87 TaxID=2044307 RepID=UPI000BF912CF